MSETYSVSPVLHVEKKTTLHTEHMCRQTALDLQKFDNQKDLI